jgi:hypothetical protein
MRRLATVTFFRSGKVARREVVEITCDRCGRTETQNSEELPKLDGPELDASFHGEHITFQDLCKRCRDAVDGYFNRLAKKPLEVLEKVVDLEQPAEDKPAPEAKKKSFLGLG